MNYSHISFLLLLGAIYLHLAGVQTDTTDDKNFFSYNNGETHNITAYVELLENLRSRLASGTNFHGIPMTRPHTNVPLQERFIRVELRTGDFQTYAVSSITVILSSSPVHFTPLQVRLNGVATFIGIVGLVVAVSVLIILLARYFTGHSKKPDGTIEFIGGKTSLSDAVDGPIKKFTVAVTIVVVAVPEGVPLAVTLTLAYSMRKMMADKALVSFMEIAGPKFNQTYAVSSITVILSSSPVRSSTRMKRS